MGVQDSSEASSDLGIGDIVFDRECEPAHSDPAVVVNTPPKTADDWTAYADTTVADDNPDYPAHAPVIVVAYRNEIADEQPEMVAPDSPIPLQDLNEVGIKHYSFPAPRLRRADPEIDDIVDIDGIDSIEESGEHNSDGMDNTTPSTPEDKDQETPAPDTNSTDTTETEPEAEETADEQELQQLKEYLLDNGVRSEIEDGVVVAEKLGQRYEIALDGAVDGDGPYRDRLEQLVGDYSS